MLSATLQQTAVRPFAHPNDLDRKRIERALKARKRYPPLAICDSRKSAGGFAFEG